MGQDNSDRRNTRFGPRHLSSCADGPGPIRLLALDDHAVVREGVRAIWAGDDRAEVTVSTDRTDVAMRAIDDDRVDVAIVDVCLATGSGIDFVSAARARNPRVAHVMLTSFRQEEAFFQAAIAGAAAFLIKDRLGEQIVDMILQVAAGHSLISPDMIDAMTNVSVDYRLPDDHVLDCLTDRERMIVAHLARGRTNGEIANELCLAEKTIRNYVSNVLAKLGMRNRTEVAAYVARSAARRDGALVRAAM